MPHTLVTFHAHPDDEALLTAGTMAKAVAEGHRVVLVVATRGEVGDAAEAFGRGLDLGARRTVETERSVAALGVHRLVFLGYGDSGGSGDGAELPAGAPPAFATADPHEAADALAAILVEENADVLTTYDPFGGYGHPDHRQVHRVGHLAGAVARTPIVLEATVSRDLLRTGVELAGSFGYQLPDEFSPSSFEEWFVPEAELTHSVDVSAHLAAKRAALEAHVSQSTGRDSAPRSLAAFLSLPDELFALAFGTEWFVDRERPPGIEAHDVFDGLTRNRNGR